MGLLAVKLKIINQDRMILGDFSVNFEPLSIYYYHDYTQIHLHRGGCFFALISIFTVFGRFFLHIHLLCMMGRFYFQTIIEFGVVTGCKMRK